MPRSDLGASIVLILFGAAVAFESWRMPRFESIGGSIYSAPGLVPGLLGLIIALLGSIMLVRYLTSRKPATAPATVSEAVATPGIADDQAAFTSAPTSGGAVTDVPATDGGFESPSSTRMLVTLVFAVVFGGILVGTVPFWLAVFLFVSASIIFYEWKKMTDARSTTVRVAIALAIAGATAFAVPFVFERIFLVTLP